MKDLTYIIWFLISTVVSGAAYGGDSPATTAKVPAAIQTIFNKPLYRGATWGLRVEEARTRKVLIDLRPDHLFFIGSVRKVFSVGELLNEVGADHRYDTPVFRRGTLDGGVLNGDLILVASGDLTMGGRTNPDGTIAITDFDHNEADSLGNAELTKPDPLAGYGALARQVAATGIKKVTGEVIVDDRLFRPFNFRKEFDVRPIFVNDDVVDLTINPTTPGSPASVLSRPMSAALVVKNSLVTGDAGSTSSLKLDPEFPQCIGSKGCIAGVTGQIPADLVPPLTNKLPLVQTFRIVHPSNYARTVFIEALRAAGVAIDAPAVEANPVKRLPAKNSYQPETRIAQLSGMPYSSDAKLILKVSYNIGADTSLMLFGLARGVDSMPEALAVERKNLVENYGLPDSGFHFVDGSGGGETTATTKIVTGMLDELAERPTFKVFFDCLPILATDGSLGFVKEFQSDTSLAGATGHIHAKTGTFVSGSQAGLALKGQAFGGYIDTRSAKRLTYQLVVNDVAITSLADVLQVFQDEGRISAILWRDN